MIVLYFADSFQIVSDKMSPFGSSVSVPVAQRNARIDYG